MMETGNIMHALRYGVHGGGINIRHVAASRVWNDAQGHSSHVRNMSLPGLGIWGKRRVESSYHCLQCIL